MRKSPQFEADEVGPFGDRGRALRRVFVEEPTKATFVLNLTYGGLFQVPVHVLFERALYRARLRCISLRRIEKLEHYPLRAGLGGVEAASTGDRNELTFY